MRICVQTSPLIEKFGVDEAFRMLREAGFDAVDYNIDISLPYNVIAEGGHVPLYDAGEEALIEYARPVKEAGENMNPSGIANYCYELVKAYNQFYHDYSILREENAGVKHMRLVLSANVAKVISEGMKLLGIEMPERM